VTRGSGYGLSAPDACCTVPVWCGTSTCPDGTALPPTVHEPVRANGPFTHKLVRDIALLTFSHHTGPGARTHQAGRSYPLARSCPRSPIGPGHWCMTRRLVAERSFQQHGRNAMPCCGNDRRSVPHWCG
jgi:hypothetical protein